jgi:hypothetical protein
MHKFLLHPKSSIKGLLLIFLLALGSFANAQVMYGDTVFWENFGNGDIRTDISGLGKINGLYKYEGPINYVYALNPQKLLDYKTANPAKSYVTDEPTWHDAPIVTTSPQYAIKPTSDIPVWDDQYFRITSWRNRTFGSVISANTENVAAWDDTFYTYATGYETQIPSAWILVDGEWKYGFYYITYTNNTRCTVADDGHYAILKNLDLFNCPTDVNWLPNNYRDHSGFLDDELQPITTGAPRVPAAVDNGRMLFVNCAAVSGVTGPVYKRLVPELCRDAEFEFSAWYASVHFTTNNTQFRIEFWSADPGNDPSLGSLDASYEGLTIPNANNARLIKVGATSPLGTPATLNNWYQVKETFRLTEQDYVWVIFRNFGQGGTGNDIVIDDLVFKPYAPFNLTVVISPASLASACVDGLVTLLSYFPGTIPAYINIPEYGFYFEGRRDGFWYRLGNENPLQTQSPTIPLEITLPLAEYNLYDMFRVAVATRPSGFGGKCVTFTRDPTPAPPIPNTPRFVISGKDICDDTTTTQQGTFWVTNTNQTACDGWHIKVRMPNGSLQTFMPSIIGSCP